MIFGELSLSLYPTPSSSTLLLLSLDASVQPPVLGVGLLDGVVARLVGLDGHDLLHEVGHALRPATDLLAHVVKLLEAARPGDDLLRPPAGE